MSCINDVFCYSRLLWLVQVRVPCVLFASHLYTAMMDCFPHSLGIQYTLSSYKDQVVLGWSECADHFLHWDIGILEVTFSNQPANLLWGYILVGKNGYTCGLSILVPLCIFCAHFDVGLVVWEMFKPLLKILLPNNCFHISLKR
jgi:hypothetical protein